jgi:hypothetical protein
MCPRATICVSSYYYICILVLLYMCPRTTIYVSSYYYTCVLVLLYMCPRTTIHVSSYYYICVLPTPTVNPATRSCATECVVCVYVSVGVGVGVGVHSYKSTCLLFVCVLVCCNVSMFHVACVLVWVCGCVRGHIIPHTHAHTHTHHTPVLYVFSCYYLCPHTTICVLMLLCVLMPPTIYVSSY